MTAGAESPLAAPVPERQLRRWLCIPERHAVPRWARRRLAAPVAEHAAARAGTPLERACFAILDLETTGLTLRDQILEIGVVVQRGGRALERFSTLVDAGVIVPPGVRALTGISQEDLFGAPTLESALARLAALLRRRPVCALVAHNAPFDRRFLARAWHEAGPPAALPPFFCSLRLARRLVRGPRHGLAPLARRLSIPLPVQHRALADAEATAGLWWELLLRAKVEGVHTLEALAPWATPGRAGARPRRRPRRVVVDHPGAIG